MDESAPGLGAFRWAVLEGRLSPPASSSRSSISRDVASCRKLEPFPRPPLVLSEEYVTKLCQRIRADIVERPVDALAIFDGERDHFAVE